MISSHTKAALFLQRDYNNNNNLKPIAQEYSRKMTITLNRSAIEIFPKK